ncbi:YcdB/YcdC domain-containing protein [Alicyclobacillus sp. SP_1]|uniref:YcdB/YcdC domain-containing protein n=1 Tax=Alicyclobacillus sp. SP_1 TaxID=2942475 RepID=UPI0021573628|nr:YcdB/YcdC domain-containing protein [Alicyclobacillus sp. SP_1]
MKRRVYLSAAVAASLAMGAVCAASPPVALAATATKAPTSRISMKKAEQLAEQRVAIPKTWVLTQASYNANQVYGESTYYFTWQPFSDESDNSVSMQNESVTVNATTGSIVSVYRSSPTNHFQFPIPVNEKQAKGIALSLVKRMYPTVSNKVRSVPLTPVSGPLSYGITYNFNFERIKNGIPAPFDGLDVLIGGHGHFQSVNTNWTDAHFPSSKHVLSEKQAQAIYKQNLGLHLAYEQIFSASGEGHWRLVYKPMKVPSFTFWNFQYNNAQFPNPTFAIDAKNGHLVESNGQTLHLPAVSTLKPVVPGGPSVLPDTLHANWTMTQSLEHAEQLLNVPSTVTPSYTSRSLEHGNVEWNFSWNLSGDSHVYAQVDATRGLVVDASRYNKSLPLAPLSTKKQKTKATTSASKAPLTQAEAEKVAIRFLQKALPEDTGAIALVPGNAGVPNGNKVANYDLDWLVHGIPVESFNDLSVNRTTGQVTQYSLSVPRHMKNFPSPEHAISLDDAEQVWLTHRPLQLVYGRTQIQYKVAKTGGKVPASSRKILLLYVPMTTTGGTGSLDALTGHFVGSANASSLTSSIRDLKNVEGGAQIRLLVEHGLLKVGPHGNVHPHQPMTVGAFVKLVMGALVSPFSPENSLSVTELHHALSGTSKSNPAYQTIRQALEEGWLPSNRVVHPNAFISRWDASQLLLKMLGDGPLLKESDIFTLPDSAKQQVSKNDRAAVAMAIGLKLFALDKNGKFNPQQPVQIDQAAVAVVRSAVLMPMSNNGMN